MALQEGFRQQTEPDGRNEAGVDGKLATPDTTESIQMPGADPNAVRDSFQAHRAMVEALRNVLDRRN